MKDEKKVRELTIPLSDCPHMPYWGTLKEAIVQLNVSHETGHDAVLVFDEGYRLVGVLTQTGILEGLGSHHGAPPKKGFEASWDSLFEKEMEERLSRPIKDFMADATVSVDASDGILAAAQTMLREKASRLPVMEGDRVLGVVRIGDVFHQITNALLGL